MRSIACLASKFLFCNRPLRQLLRRTHMRTTAFALFTTLFASSATAFAASPTVTTLAITAGGNTVTTVQTGTVVTLTATVTSGSTLVTPGVVNFCDATAAYCADVHIVGSAQLTSAGTAVIRFRPGTGSHSYKAVFAGTGTYATSTSTASPLTVNGSFLTATTLQSSGNSGSISASIAVNGLGSQQGVPAVMPSGTVQVVDTSNSDAVLATETLTAGSSAFALVPGLIPGGPGGAWTLNGIAAADFNGDGIPDLAIGGNNGSQSNYVLIYTGNGDGTFSTGSAVLVNAGNSISDVTAGDFNNDGIMDLVVTTANVVSFLLGNGDGTFTLVPSTVPVGGLPIRAQVADVNNDGNADVLLMTSTSPDMIIFLGHGDGTFSASGVQVGPYTYSVLTGFAVADFNHDGNQDLVAVFWAAGNPDYAPLTEAVVLLGDGNGGFPQTSVVILNNSNSPGGGVATGDLNGDGIPDMVVNAVGNVFNIMLGKGDGTFTYASQSLTAPTGGFIPVIEDFNGDGVADVALSGNPASVYLGKGDGTFAAAVTTSDNFTGSHTISTDLNGDGIPDLISGTSNSTNIAATVLAQLQNQSTASANFTVTPGTHNLVAQYAGDSVYAPSTSAVDVVKYIVPTSLTLAANPQSAPVGQPITLTATLTPSTQGDATTNGQTITFSIPGSTLGTGTLSNGVASLTVSNLPIGNQVVSATFTGNDQFGASSGSATVNILNGSQTAPTITLAVTAAGNPVTTITPGTVVTLTATVTAGGAPVSPGLVNFCDATANYCTDIHIIGSAQLTSAGTAIVRVRPGAGSHSYKAVFVGTATYGTGVSNTSSFSVSPYPTIMQYYLTNYDDTSESYTNNVQAHITVTGLSNRANLPGASPTGTVTLTDTTNGGNTVVGTPLLTPGTSSFTTVGTAAGKNPVGGYSGGIATADFNGDGIPDIVAGVPGPYISVGLGKGDGSFTDLDPITIHASTTGCRVSGIAAGDFNNDGIPDLAVASPCTATGSGNVYILTGKGDGTFNPVSFTANVADINGTIKTGDFNGDGIVDLIAFSETAGGVTLLGHGDGTFQTKTATITTVGTYTESIAVADFNLDGKQDVAITATGNGSSNVLMLLGNGDGTFTPASQQPSVPLTDGVAAGDLNSDGVPDLVVGTSGYYAILLGKGDGTFSLLSKTLLTYHDEETFPPVITDINGDGIPDIAGFNAFTIYAWFGAGDGTFTQVLPTDTSIGNSQFSGEMVSADFNGDGVPDLMVNYGSSSGFLADGMLLEFQNQSTATTNFTISPGTHHVLAQYPGDTNWASISQTANVQYQLPTTLTLTSSPGGSFTVGESITFTATVSPVAQDGASTDGGVVDFTSNGTTLGTGILSGGVATFTTTFVPAGYYPVTAQYTGSDQFQPSSQGYTFVINKLTPTLELSSSSSYVSLGQSVTLTATASGGYTPSLPGEVVTFSANGAQIGTATLSSSNVATLVWTPADTGPQNILAVSGGDANNNSATSNHGFVTVLKAGESGSNVTLQVNGSTTTSSVTAGSPVTLSATVSSGGSPVTAGTVRFCDLTTPTQLCSNLVNAPTAQLNASGEASLTTRLGPGQHSLVAYFNGTSTAGLAASTPLAVSGGPFAAQLTQTCEVQNFPWCDASLTLSAPLKAVTPTGKVNFVDKSASDNVTGSAILFIGGEVDGFHRGFPQHSPSTTGSKPFSMANADFNHDGWPDLAVTNSGDNTVSILLGKGDATFQTQVAYATGAGPYAVAVGDFNHDGNPDLAVTNFSGNTVSILLGNADGTFQAQHTFATGGGPVAIAISDFNADGQLDLAIANNLDNTVSILTGNGDGTFQAQVTYATGTGPNAIVTADFNGDQAADLAIANNSDSTISILLGKNDGTFQAQVTYATGAGPVAMTLGDFDGDSKIDLAVADLGDGTIKVFPGAGDGTFPSSFTAFTLEGAQAIAAGVFADQGRTDLWAASSTSTYFLANNGGTFTGYKLSPSSATGLIAITVADWDGNGVSDLALLGNSSNSVVGVQNGSYERWETGAEPLQLAPPSGTHQIVAQYDGDSNYPALMSSASNITLSAISTKLTVSSNRNPSNYGDAVTLTATLTPYSSGSTTTNGETVTFSSGATVLGTGALSSGVATLTTSSMDTGVDTVTATYTADQYFAGATGSLAQTVRPPTLTITAENTTRVYGAANPAFDVHVTGAVNGDTFTTSASTSATSTSSAGSYSIVPSVSGAHLANYNVVKVNGTLTITPATPTINLQSSAGQVFTSTPVTFTATVSSVAGVPSGTVSFLDGSTMLGSAALTSGTAMYQTSSLTFGVHNITAVYSGDTNFTAATSPALTQTIENFTITIPSGGGSTTVSPGGTASYTFNVAPPNGTKFLSNITFSVTGAPSGSTSTFSPSSIASNSGATDVTLEVKLPNNTAAAARPAPSPFGIRSLPIALGLVFLPWLLPLQRRVRHWLLTGLFIALGLSTLGIMNGCGSGSSSSGGGGGNQPQTYTLTVSANSGSLSQTTKFTLTVK